MLIIAIPKSASSSLISSMSNHYGLVDETALLRRRHQAKCSQAKNYIKLSKWHSEMVEISQPWLCELCENSKIIAKHHFPPTDHNLDHLKDIKKVILLRRPEEIVMSHYRGHKSGVFPILSEDFAFCFSEVSWIKQARKTGLLKELHDFYNGWSGALGDQIIVYYDNLVAQPEVEMERIVNYWGLDANAVAIPILEKKRYSRKIEKRMLRNILMRLYYRCKVILKLILISLVK